jgi:hypothetical protein
MQVDSSSSSADEEDDAGRFGSFGPSGEHVPSRGPSRVGATSANPVIVVDAPAPVSTKKKETVGSGLKRNADGSVVAPRVIPRKTGGGKVRFLAV